MRNFSYLILLLVAGAVYAAPAQPTTANPYDATGAMFKALGIPEDKVRKEWSTPELKLCAALWHDAKLGFESGHIGICEVWDRELAALQALMSQPEIASSPLMPELRQTYLKRLHQQLDMLKMYHQAGNIGLAPIQKKEFEIARFREIYLPGDKPNAELVELAEKYLVKIYGERVLKERPWRVADNGDTLTIKGKKLPKGCCGGVAEITIRKSDGKVLKCIHYK